jgi:uncharacterized protein YciI
MTMKLALVSAALLATSVARPHAAPPHLQGELPVMHLVLLEHGPNWPASPNDPGMRKLLEHRTYVGPLFADGTFVVGGPAVDQSCGILVVNLSERAAVERIVQGDPAVQAEVFAPEIRAFSAVQSASFAPRPALPAAPAGLEPIRKEVVVGASLAAAWNAWSTARGQQEFFAPHVELELAPLGAYEVHFLPANPEGQRGAENLRVLSWVPESMISFEWSSPPQFPGARAERSFFTIELEALGATKTRVTLTHLGFAERAAARPELAEEWKGSRAYFDQAWGTVLERMQRRFVSGPIDFAEELGAPKPGGGASEPKRR